MSQNIAVCVGKDGSTVPFLKNGQIRIYQKNQKGWMELRKVNYSLESEKTIKDLRRKLQELVASLNECKVFVALSVTGLPYFMLEKAEFSIWECKGEPLEFLDYILKKEEEKSESEASEELTVQSFLIEVSPGHYTISLKAIQKKNIQITSKQALLPFIRKGNFNSLEIECSHIPPWLECEAISRGFKKDIIDSHPGSMKLLIAKQT